MNYILFYQEIKNKYSENSLIENYKSFNLYDTLCTSLANEALNK